MPNATPFNQPLEAAYERFQSRSRQRSRRAEAALERGRAGEAEAPERAALRLETLGVAPAESRRIIESVWKSGAETYDSFIERVIGPSRDFRPTAFFREGADLGRAVGKITVRDRRRRVRWPGSGYRISPRLVMTNHHVLERRDDAYESFIEFDFEERGPYAPAKSARVSFDPDAFFYHDEHLDFALVATADTEGDRKALQGRPWAPLIRGSGKALLKEPVNVIQHPDGRSQEVSFRDSEIVDVFDDFIHYRADTEPGSSGSPVFSDSWAVAALHHSGVPERDNDGSYLRDEWGRIVFVANEGVRISSIVAHLDGVRFEKDEQKLLSGAFEPYEPAASGLAGPRQPQSGRAAPVAPAADDPSVETPPNAFARAADRFLARIDGAGDPFHDAERDAAERAAYYAGLDLKEDGAVVYRTLTRLIARTHTSPMPSYRTARLKWLYPVVDTHPDGSLRSIYSGESLSLNEVVAHEFAALSERSASVFEACQHSDWEALIAAGGDALDLNVEESFMEAQHPFNCEHVVPQSWFAKREPMRSDLHHLFTCEPRCNSARSNHPYFDFEGYGELDERVRDSCGRYEEASDGRWGFEPEAGRGAVARATLYFLLRYPGLIGDVQREMPASRLNVLLRWNEIEPVTDYERRRNAMIQKAQGNRNPFIDFPELAGRLPLGNSFG